MKVFLYILVIILAIGIISILDILFFKEKSLKRVILTILKHTGLVFLFTPWILAGVFKEANVLLPLMHDNLFFLKHFGVSMLVGGVFLFIKRYYSRIKALGLIKREKKGKVIALYVVSVILFFLAIFVLTLTLWAKATYSNATIDEIIITLTSPIDGTSSDLIIGFVEDSLFPSLASTYLFALIFYDRIIYVFNRGEKGLAPIKYLKPVPIVGTMYTAIISAGIIALSTFTYGLVRFDIPAFVVNQLQKSEYIENNYKNPRDVKLTFDENKRNLIHIYLESIENSYFDKANGGHMEESLMPNLLNIANNTKDAYSFSHLSVSPLNGGPKGGPLTTNGATWSVASMVNQSFGVPMMVSASRNNYGTGENKFYPGAIGVGDILKAAGYNQTMMIGARASFGGLDNMFRLHGDFKIMDYTYARAHGMVYDKKGWGYVDEDLYRFAKAEITRLANEPKPFHFVMENADTHFPGFHFNGDEPEYSSNLEKDYGKTIKFSDKHVSEFISWIIKQPFYENTTVIIIGDHLSMDRKFFQENSFKGYNRTTFNLILNPATSCKGVDESRFYNRRWATYDMMPTLLASIGVEIEGNRLGLGTNLFSNEKTLYERDGYSYANGLYRKTSPYYDNVLLKEGVPYTGSNLVLPTKKEEDENK